MQLPLRENLTLEYALDEDSPPWVIGNWPEFSAKFNLTAPEVPAWHAVLSNQGRPWELARRRFLIAPLWGEEDLQTYARQWQWPELAASMGVPAPLLQSDLEAAVEFWKRQKMAVASGPVAGGVVNPLDTPVIPPFAIHQELANEQITALLVPLRFDYLRSDSDRLYVANRILELRARLEDKHTRESARQLINMELSMANHELMLSLCRARMEVLRNTRELTAAESTEIHKISDTAANTEKTLTSLATAYRKAADDLGADEAEEGELRRVALGSISYFLEAIRIYYATGERTQVDGVFPADELVWLTTPHTLRPAQYRPDLVLRVREALVPENLWAKDYEPTPLQREACRRLQRLAQAMAEEEPPPVIPGVDDGSETTGDDDEDELAPALPTPEESGQPLPAQPAAPPYHPEEPCMAI